MDQAHVAYTTHIATPLLKPDTSLNHGPSLDPNRNSKTKSKWQTYPLAAAADNFDAVRNVLARFPELQKNKFFITGER